MMLRGGFAHFVGRHRRGAEFPDLDPRRVVRNDGRFDGRGPGSP